MMQVEAVLQLASARAFSVAGIAAKRRNKLPNRHLSAAPPLWRDLPKRPPF
jgi:hypothetical protein